MSIYGELGDEFRPRPAWWRIALTSAAQFIISIAITNLLLTTGDAILLIQAGIARALIIRLGTWRSLAPLPGFDAEHAVIAVVLLIIAEIVIDFLPMPRTLAMRSFAITLAEALAVFGAIRIAVGQPLIAGIVIAFAAILFLVRTELAAVRLFNNVMDMKRPLRRFLVWLCRFGVWSAAAALPLSPWKELAILCGVTLLVNLATKPGERWEEVSDPELHEAAAALPLIAALIVGLLLWMSPRVVIVTTRGASVRQWKPIESDLAKRLRDRETRR